MLKLVCRTCKKEINRVLENGVFIYQCVNILCVNTVRDKHSYPDAVPWWAEEIAIKEDNINHPSHYTSHPAKCECGKQIECIDVTRHMSFNLGNAIKYLWRFEHKNGIEDLKKARWYLDDEIKKRETEV